MAGPCSPGRRRSGRSSRPTTRGDPSRATRRLSDSRVTSVTMSLVDQLDTVTDASAGTVDRHATTQTFESTNPASGAVVGVFPVHNADAVRETVERARPAAERWAALGFDGRKQRLA